MPSRSLPKSEYRALADAYAAGASATAVGERFGRSRDAVKTACRMFGIPMRPRGGVVTDDDPRFPAIREAIAAGVSKRDVMKRFKTCATVVNRAMGLPEARQRAKHVERLPADPLLADELEMAIERDAVWLRELDARRAMMRMVA